MSLQYSAKSNIGKQSIPLQSTTLFVDLHKQSFFLKGRLGVLECKMSSFFLLELFKLSEAVKIVPKGYANPHVSTLWGTYRSVLRNAIVGVNLGFVQNLALVGLGYKASLQDDSIKLKVGKSHEVSYKVSPDVKVKFFTNTLLSLRGVDLQKIRHTAYQIHRIKKPDVYKNKGIRLPQIRLTKKEGKKQK